MPEQLYWMYPWMHLVGRVLLALVFVLNGVFHIMKLRDMSAYAGGKGVPAANVAVSFSGLMILVGGVLIGLGWHRFIGAWLIVIFLIPVTFWMHNFWKQTDPAARMVDMQHFLKNMALLGAALLVAYYAGGYWPMSLGG